MRKILGVAVVAMSLMSGATVVLAQSSRDLTEVTGTEANRLRTHYGPYNPGVSVLCVRAPRAPTMALVSPALVIHCRTRTEKS